MYIIGVTGTPQKVIAHSSPVTTSIIVILSGMLLLPMAPFRAGG